MQCYLARPMSHVITAKIKGVSLLVLTTILWGTSFVFIKLSVSNIDPFSYTAYRTLFATVVLTAILVVLKMMGRPINMDSMVKGMITGIAYASGLLLQAAGTAYTTPSLSAFITGFNTIHVHVYVALLGKSYGVLDLLALLLSMLGLYVLTSPQGGIGIGELLVFLGSIAWAAQIILISKYRHTNVLEFLHGMFLTGSFMAPLAYIVYGFPLDMEILKYLAYLAVVCSIGATFFQVWGQKYVSAASAAVIFLLEPVFALLFSVLMGMEELEIYKVLGGGMIVISTYIVTLSEMRKKPSQF
ncbi:MAG: DMT family transporter [Desulfurococcaceae archaeon]